MQSFLESGPVIDYTHPQVAAKAGELRVLARDGGIDAMATAQRCFEFVRDAIAHSGDIRSDLVTLKASEVLQHVTGWCFAKSHLLAALLRANGIPAALCYQRLQKDAQGDYTLHGLNAVYLPEHGWYRCDARGNKEGVDAQFTPPVERLAWPAFDAGECDYPERYASPVPAVVGCLTQSRNYREVYANLPDPVSPEA